MALGGSVNIYRASSMTYFVENKKNKKNRESMETKGKKHPRTS